MNPGSSLWPGDWVSIFYSLELPCANVSPCQKSQQNNQRKPNVPDQRPKWHRQTKKGPVDLGAVAGAGKRLVEYFTEREACIQHEVHAWTAVRHLVGRQILQPDMTPCGHDSPGATGQNRHAPQPAPP